MNTEELAYGYGPYKHNKMGWEHFLLEEYHLPVKREKESYNFLEEYSDVYNLYPASTSQPNPFSNKAMYIINTLTKMGVKYTIDIFTYEGNSIHWNTGSANSHKLVNIIAEPNSQVEGAAIVFCGHHDVANVHSQNCQDNGASVCNLLRLASIIKKAPAESKRTIILFSDCEESGARGAKRFAYQSTKKKEEDFVTHDIYGKIDSVVNLELTGKGTEVWSDCTQEKPEIELHNFLEKTLGKKVHKFKTPPNDAITFRRYNYPVLCIGTLPKEDLKEKDTWRLCHSIKDTIEGCSRKDMEDFTQFLFNLTKVTQTDKETI